MMPPALLPQWKVALDRFSENLERALADAQLGVRLGGQPESVTTSTLVYPMLRMLGYDPERMNECVPQGRPQSPSKSGSASFLKAPVDLCLFPACGNRIPLEVKPFSMTAASLRSEVGQIDLYMRYNRSKVGLKTNGMVLLVLAIPDNAERNAAPELVSEFDLGDLRPEQASDLFQLHRRRFIEGAWTQKASRSLKADLPPTIEFGRVEEAVINVIRAQRPSLTQSEILRAAILEGVPKIKQLEAGIEASHPLAVPPPKQEGMGERMLRHLEALIAEEKVTAREIEDAAKAEHGDLKRLWAKKGLVPPSCVGRIAKLLAGKKLPIGPREAR